MRGAERGCVRALRSYGDSYLASELRQRLEDSVHLLASPGAPLQMEAADDATGTFCGRPDKGYNEETLRSLRLRADAALLVGQSKSPGGRQLIEPGAV